MPDTHFTPTRNAVGGSRDQGASGFQPTDPRSYSKDVGYTPTTKTSWPTVPVNVREALDWLGDNSALKNFAATTAPTVNDDADDGFGVGSWWFDVTADLVWVCIDASVGSASWLEVAAPLHNRTATTAPTVNDDADDDWSVGSWWFDVTADLIWVCIDATVGAAIWKEFVSKAELADTTSPVEGATLIGYKPDRTVWQMLDDTITAGVLTEISVSDDGSRAISWGAGLVVDFEQDIVTTNAGSGTCADGDVSYLLWSAGSTLTLGTVAPGGDEIAVATIACQENDIYTLHVEPIIREFPHEVHHALAEIMPIVVADGVAVSADPDGTNDRDVLCTSGEYYTDGHHGNVVPAIFSQTVNLVRWFHSSGVWTSDTDAELDNEFWDNGTDLVAMGIKKWFKSLFLVSAPTATYPNGAIHWVYPQEQFNTEGAAVLADPPAIPPGLALLPCSSTVVMQEGDTDFTNATWKDVRPLAFSAGTGAGVASSGDVIGIAPSVDQNIAIYQGTTGKVIEDGGESITDLLDRLGTRPMLGDLDMDDFDILASGTINTDFLFVAGGVAVMSIVSNASGPTFAFQRSRTGPAAVQSGDVLGDLQAWGHDASTVTKSGMATWTASENWSGAAQGTQLSFALTAIGEADDPNEVLRLTPVASAATYLEVRSGDGSTAYPQIRGSGNKVGMYTTGAGYVDVNGDDVVIYGAPETGTVTIQAATMELVGVAAAFTAEVLNCLEINVLGGGGGLPLTTTDASSEILMQPEGLKAFTAASVASAVNYLAATNAATGSGPSLGAAGTDTDIDLLFSAKGTGSIEITGDTRITGLFNLDDGTALVTVASATVAAPAQLQLRRARGTLGSPTAVSDNDELGELALYGHDGNAYGIAATIRALADEDWGVSDHGSRLEITLTGIGDTSETLTVLLTEDKWLFNNGGVDTGFGFGTSGDLEFLIGATAEMTLDAAGLDVDARVRCGHLAIDAAVSTGIVNTFLIDVSFDSAGSSSPPALANLPTGALGVQVWKRIFTGTVKGWFPVYL